MGRDKSEQGASSKLQTRGMERSARVYRRSAEKLARFFRARKRMSDVIGAAFIFFFPYPSNPNWVTFSIRPSIDRSIDPRREIVCRIETAALRRFLCAVYLRAKRKAPAGNRVNKCWGLRVWIRIYAWGWLGVRAGNATSRRRIVHDQVERVTFFFPDTSVARPFSMGWAEFGEEEEVGYPRLLGILMSFDLGTVEGWNVRFKELWNFGRVGRYCLDEFLRFFFSFYGNESMIY